MIRVNPAAPAADMLHLHLPVSRERTLAIRAELAERHGIWLFNQVSNGVLPDTSYPTAPALAPCRRSATRCASTWLKVFRW